jgi:hypothetical protein
MIRPPGDSERRPVSALHKVCIVPERPVDFDSTLIRAGSEASTLGEITAFTQMIGERPISVLLDDLATLEFLTETKFQLARRALERRIRGMGEEERGIIRTRLRTLERADPAAAERLRDLVGNFD